MKKLCVFLALLLLFASCQRKTHLPNLPEAVEIALSQYGDETDFVRADPDFVATNFNADTEVEEAAVYLSQTGDGTEFGFFSLRDEGDKAKMIAAIDDYLESERQAVEALAALYPAEELEQRRMRFDCATVGATERLVYYFLTDPHIAKQTLKQLCK